MAPDTPGDLSALTESPPARLPAVKGGYSGYYLVGKATPRHETHGQRVKRIQCIAISHGGQFSTECRRGGKCSPTTPPWRNDARPRYQSTSPYFHLDPSPTNHDIVRAEPIGGVSLLASHQGEPGSILDRVTPGFSYVGIVPDDSIGRRVSSGISRFPALAFRRCSISQSPSSALKTSLLRTAQIS
ncbi:hypothetical protein PR048_017788 [Dryococelus australis]|uniref:Uncharacterized protein n=1 Tax=Dryococelus australis TaxID=614101 RepID=A0ABQ9HAF5_9NEOP|nr:hypothetical protein PR048_017788 [Dryococelus australis]